MRILLTIIRSLYSRAKTDLNYIAQSVFVGNITVQEAVQIYGLNLRELEYVRDNIAEYRAADKYITERLSQGI